MWNVSYFTELYFRPNLPTPLDICLIKWNNDIFGVFQHKRQYPSDEANILQDQNTLKSRPLTSGNEWLMEDTWMLLFWPGPERLRRPVHQTTITSKNPRPQAKMILMLFSFLSFLDTLSISLYLCFHFQKNKQIKHFCGFF